VTASNPLATLNKAAVLTVAEWRVLGISDSHLRSLVRSGYLVRIRRGVYATRQAIRFSQQDGHGGAHALLAVSAQRVVRGSVISHHSAARLYEMDLLNPPQEHVVTLTLRPGRRGYSRGPGQSGVVTHRASLPDNHVRKLSGALVTTPERTVIDVARASSFMQGVVVADSALRKELTYITRLEDMADACQHWPGAALAARVAQFANPLAESVFESCARVVFHEKGLDPPELQAQFLGGRFRVDFCWEQYKVIAEADGLDKYVDDPRRRVANQTRRDNELRRLGYEVVHFTWAELFENPEKVVADIIRAMRRKR
jgi:very-short-patch-repair endonuclease